MNLHKMFEYFTEKNTFENVSLNYPILTNKTLNFYL